MKYCFFISTESSDWYYNQTKFLLYSFRKYAGEISDSFFYVSVNDGNLSEERIKFLEDNLSPIQVVNKKVTNKIGPYGYDRKFNLYRHFDRVDEFDKFVSLDADLMFGADLDMILSQGSENQFTAIPSRNINEVVSDYENFISCNFKLNEKNINDIKVQWGQYNSVNELPHFNSGFFMVDKIGFSVIKNYIHEYLKKCYNLLTSSELKTEGWNFEQTALGILVATKIKDFGAFDFSWEGPEVFHNFKNEYGRLHYDKPQNVNLTEYQNSGSKNKQFISKIIKEFYEEYPNEI
jgi:hypothetical protein